MRQEARWSHLFDRFRCMFWRLRFLTDEEVAGASHKFGGMTVNERLVLSGLIDRWDDAVAKRDRDALLRICAQVGIADGPAGRSWVVDHVLARGQR